MEGTYPDKKTTPHKKILKREPILSIPSPLPQPQLLHIGSPCLKENGHRFFAKKRAPSTQSYIAHLCLPFEVHGSRQIVQCSPSCREDRNCSKTGGQVSPLSHLSSILMDDTCHVEVSHFKFRGHFSSYIFGCIQTTSNVRLYFHRQ